MYIIDLGFLVEKDSETCFRYFATILNHSVTQLLSLLSIFHLNIPKGMNFPISIKIKVHFDQNSSLPPQPFTK